MNLYDQYSYGFADLEFHEETEHNEASTQSALASNCDGDDDMMYDEDSCDYHVVEDEAEDEEEDWMSDSIEIECSYYNSKGMRQPEMVIIIATYKNISALVEESISEAIKSYEKVVNQENEKGEWYYSAQRCL